MIIVHYEVYVLEGRGWMLHARFPRNERETAINEAKELEQNLNIRVRVVRETYYTDDNNFEEAEVYVSGGKMPDRPKTGPVTAAPTRSAPGKTAASSSSARPAPARRPAASLTAAARAEMTYARKMLVRLILVGAVGLAAGIGALLITPDIINAIWRMGFPISLSQDVYNTIMGLVFTGTFLSVSVPLGLKMMPSKAQQTRGVISRAPVQTARDKAVKKSLDKLANKALWEQMTELQKDEQDADKSQDPDKQPDLPPLPDDDLPQINVGSDEDLPELRPDPEDAPADDRPQADGKTGTAQDQAVSSAQLQPQVMKFLDGAVATTKSVVPNLDAYNKFALHLYLAGAVDALCSFKKQGGGTKSKLVATALETLGSGADVARKFYDKLPEYSREARYRAALDAGRSAMGDFMLGNESGAHSALRELFEAWNRKGGDRISETITVMFTDMVGSTDLTQARGDSAAQEVVRKHNSIVRTVLSHYNGKEVKHTGDGIMASFVAASAAVDAAVAIQRQVAAHNARMPNLALTLRIGLNAGEPIVEENDLFGATVQLAARVCAATNPEQILCTTVVKDLSLGKTGAQFQDMGARHLKGFKDAIPLFEVPWATL